MTSTLPFRIPPALAVMLGADCQNRMLALFFPDGEPFHPGEYFAMLSASNYSSGGIGILLFNITRFKIDAAESDFQIL